jgi:hypothetical protein
VSVKKHVLLSVESKQGVELYTGDLVVGPRTVSPSSPVR